MFYLGIDLGSSPVKVPSVEMVWMQWIWLASVLGLSAGKKELEILIKI